MPGNFTSAALRSSWKSRCVCSTRVRGSRLGYRLDLLVADAVVVEVKSVDAIHPVHEAQLMSYMKLGGWKVGLLLNFNVRVLKDGIRRKIIGKID